MSILNDFTDQELINATNIELKNYGSNVVVKSLVNRFGHDYITAKSSRGATLVIQPVCIYNRGKIGIRAVHRVVDKSRNFTYLFNGQGGKNLQEVAHIGESGNIYEARSICA